jgi:Tfp pilus assembly protein PilF
MVTSACAGGAGTERLINGQTVHGRWIPPSAYASHAAGAYYEQRGDWTRAEQAYRRALNTDSDSPGTWSRIGAVACHRDLANALRAFDEAQRLDPKYAQGWSERAACLQRHGQPEPALAAAFRALRLAPHATGTNLLIADIYASQANRDEALRWLFALILTAPSTAAHWQALRRHSAPESALGQLAASALKRRHPDDRSTKDSPSLRAVGDATETEAALASADLPGAQQAAAHAGLSPTRLALMAAQMGQTELAQAQARLLLDAAPNNTDALAAALFASTLAGDITLTRHLLRAGEPRRPPSKEAAELVAELIRWLVGDAAAQRFSAAHRLLNPPTK